MSDEWMIRLPELELKPSETTPALVGAVGLESEVPAVESELEPVESVLALVAEGVLPSVDAAAAVEGEAVEGEPPEGAAPEARGPHSEEGAERCSEEDSPQDFDTAAVEVAGPQCPYCREALLNVPEGHQEESTAPERPVACTECGTPVHARCAQMHGRCVSLGCAGRSFAFVDRIPRPRIRATRLRRAQPPSRGPGWRRARREAGREPEPAPECPPDWWRRDAPLLVVGLIGILSLALFGDSLALEGKRFDTHYTQVMGK